MERIAVVGYWAVKCFVDCQIPASFFSPSCSTIENSWIRVSVMGHAKSGKTTLLAKLQSNGARQRTISGPNRTPSGY